MSKPFRFKQFSVAQNRCAMKVNTDGVLLGAWAEVAGANRILDIGTGTGVIALMMAQKNIQATIDAIDIDADHSLQAKENFLHSFWSDRLTAFHISLQDFAPQKKYDLIISNPPYFVDDTHAPDNQKNIARHGVTLSYQDFVIGIGRLLSEKGRAYLVLPVFNVSLLQALAVAKNLFITKLTEVIAVSGKPPYLAMICLEKASSDMIKKTLEIQNSEGGFTDEYQTLTKDFYLKF